MEEAMRALRITAALAIALSLGCGNWKRFAYERGRDDWQQPERVVAALGIEPGDRVADLGSGSGYFTLRLAEAVGSTGVVYAVDVDADMNEYLREKVKQAGAANVEVIDGKFEDPLLPDGRIDLVFSANTFHHIQQRPAYFRNLQRDLAPGGRVAIIDYNDTTWFPRLMGHHTDKAVLIGEMQEAGYGVAEDHGFVERQNFVVFEPRRP
jgi:arsenite methyltransferase